MVNFASLLVLLATISGSSAKEKLKLAYFGDFSGPLFTFGPNTNGVIQAAVKKINSEGGVTLKNGENVEFEVTPFDSACSGTRAVGIVKRLYQADYLLGIGPTCSGVARPLFSNLAYKKPGSTFYDNYNDRVLVAGGGVDGADITGADIPDDGCLCEDPTGGSGFHGPCLATSGDRGLCPRFPVFTDCAISPGLAMRSQYAFRQVPNEGTMYDALFNWIDKAYPDLSGATVFGGLEYSNAHSFLTYQLVIRPKAVANGFKVMACEKSFGETRCDLSCEDGTGLIHGIDDDNFAEYGVAVPCVPKESQGGNTSHPEYDPLESGWCEGASATTVDPDTNRGLGLRQRWCGFTEFRYQYNYTKQVHDLRRMNSDIVVLAAHPFTACGMLKEMKRQRVQPKLLIGLTSTSNSGTLRSCSSAAEGMIIPTSFAPINDLAMKVSTEAAKEGGETDLHSAAGWEIMHILKDVVEKHADIKNTADSVQEDREAIRDALENLSFAVSGENILMGDTGLLGESTRFETGDMEKPFLFVQASGTEWTVKFPPKPTGLGTDTKQLSLTSTASVQEVLDVYAA